MVEYDGVDVGGGGGKLVKSRKTSKVWKIAKAIGLEEPSFLTSDTRLVFTKMVRNSQ